MNLITITPDFVTRYDGSDKLSISAGTKIEFKTFGGGPVNKFFEAEVPTGKKWDVNVIVSITEITV